MPPPLLLLLLPCCLALPPDLPAERRSESLLAAVNRTGRSLRAGAADQQVQEAILSINYRDKLGNLKTLRGRTQQLRIKKKGKDGVRRGELDAGQIAALVKKLSNKGRTRGRVAALRQKKNQQRLRAKLAAQTLLVSPGLAAVPADPLVEYEYEYYDDDYESDYEYADYGDPIAVVKTIVEEELVPVVHHVEEPLHHNEVIPVYGSLDDHDPYGATPVVIHEDHGYGHGHARPQHKPVHHPKPHHVKPYHPPPKPYHPPPKPYHPPPTAPAYHHKKNRGYHHVSLETPNYRYEVENYGEPEPYYPPPPQQYHKQPQPYHEPPPSYHEPGPPYYEEEPYYEPSPQYHEPSYGYKKSYGPSYRSKPPPPNHHKDPYYEPYYPGGSSVEVRPNVYIELKAEDKHYRPRFGHPYQPEPEYHPKSRYPAHHKEPVYYEKPRYPEPCVYPDACGYYDKPRYPEPAHHAPPPSHHAPPPSHRPPPPPHRGPPPPNPKPEVLHDPRFSDLIESRGPSSLIPNPADERSVDGRAFGADLVGGFDHHTGEFGPFGFYANYYDQK